MGDLKAFLFVFRVCVSASSPWEMNTDISDLHCHFSASGFITPERWEQFDGNILNQTSNPMDFSDAFDTLYILGNLQAFW